MLDGMVSRTVPVVPAETPYAAFFKFGWLSAGGTAILLSGFFAVPFMPKYSFGKAVACFFSTIYQLRFPVLTIATILGLAFLMNYSGMSTTSHRLYQDRQPVPVLRPDLAGSACS